MNTSNVDPRTHNHIRRFSLVPLLAAVSLFASGCATSNQPTTSVDSKTAIADIAALQNRTQSAAAAFKKGHPATDDIYISVRSKYRDAAAKNKGYLAAVQAGVMNRERNFDTPSYRAIAKDAGDTAKDFVNLAEQNTPADVRPVGMAPTLIIEAADILVRAGISIWKANNEMAAEKAKAVADSLKQYKWPAWDSL
jgi:hypothetical protein